MNLRLTTIIPHIIIYRTHFIDKDMTPVKKTIKFGTDGWRAIIAQDFTFDNVIICAQGVADYIKQLDSKDKGIVIGYDTRFASEDFAAVTAEVIAGNNIKVYLCSKPTPTPVISHGILHTKAIAGIIITASHNPPNWNGFKLKTKDGASAPSEMITKVEENINNLTNRKVKQISLLAAINKGLVEYLDLAPTYIKHIEQLIDLHSVRRSGMTILVDSMFGAGIGYFHALLGNGNCNLIEINNNRNPLFPGMKQPEPIDINLTKLASNLIERKANVGLATDGDADRIGIIDERGIFLTSLQVFALLALYFLEIRGERGPIVKTITSTSMLFRLGEIFGVPVYETPVGFKYVAPIMLSEKALIGGEESGGYGFRGHVPERDGILAGLYFLDFMVKTGKAPSQLVEYLYSKVGPHYYQRIDLEFPRQKHQAIINHINNNLPKSIAGIKVVHTNTFDGFHFILDDTSWLLIRFSGTEPVLRIYAEAKSSIQLKGLLNFGRDLVGV